MNGRARTSQDGTIRIPSYACKRIGVKVRYDGQGTVDNQFRHFRPELPRSSQKTEVLMSREVQLHTNLYVEQRSPGTSQR